MPQHAVVRGMIDAILSARPALYHLPELADVNTNHGSRISQKVVAYCKQLAKDAGMDPKVVDEEIKKRSSGGKGRPKGDNASGGGTPKKRKVAAKDESDELREE